MLPSDKALCSDNGTWGEKDEARGRLYKKRLAPLSEKATIVIYK